jgi:putative glutamine amidotransferase
MKPRIAIPRSCSIKPAHAARVMPQYSSAIERARGEPVEIALDLDNHRIARLATTCDAVLLPGSPADLNPEKYGAAREPQTADGDPMRDNVDEILLQDAYNMRKPVLGICFGLQSLNVWRTGTLRQHLATGVVHSDASATPVPVHRVVVAAQSMLGNIVVSALGKALIKSGFERDGLQAVREIQQNQAASAAEGLNQRLLAVSGSTDEIRGGLARDLLALTVNSAHHQAVLKPGDALRAAAWCPDDHVIEALEGTEPDHWVIAVQWHPERMTDDPAAIALFCAFVVAAGEHRKHPRVDVVDFENRVIS